MFALARKLSVSKADALMFNAILDFIKAESVLKRWTYAISVHTHILFRWCASLNIWQIVAIVYCQGLK